MKVDRDANMQVQQHDEFSDVPNSGLTPEQAAVLQELTVAVYATARYNDLMALAIGFFEQIGSGAFTCAIFENEQLALVGFSSSMRHSLIEAYEAAGLAADDPLVTYIQHNTDPAVLGFGFGTTAVWQQGTAVKMLGVLEQNGYTGLLFQPVRLEAAPYSSAVTLFCEMPTKQAQIYLYENSTLLLLSAKAIAVRAAYLFEPGSIDQTWQPRRSQPLSAREYQVVRALSRGDRPEQIAFDLKIKPVTVHMHVASARQKLDARTREQLVSLALQKGLV